MERTRRRSRRPSTKLASESALSSLTSPQRWFSLSRKRPPVLFFPSRVDQRHSRVSTDGYVSSFSRPLIFTTHTAQHAPDMSRSRPRCRGVLSSKKHKIYNARAIVVVVAPQTILIIPHTTRKLSRAPHSTARVGINGVDLRTKRVTHETFARTFARFTIARER